MQDKTLPEKNTHEDSNSKNEVIQSEKKTKNTIYKIIGRKISMKRESIEYVKTNTNGKMIAEVTIG